MTQAPSGDSLAPAARAVATVDAPRTQGRSPRRGDDGTTVTRRGRGKKLAVYAALIGFSLVYIYPFVVQVSTSLKTTAMPSTTPWAWCPTR